MKQDSKEQHSMEENFPQQYVEVVEAVEEDNAALTVSNYKSNENANGTRCTKNLK